MTDKYHKKSLDKLVDAMTGGRTSDWWKSPNKAFDGRPPIELMNDEEWEKVRNYLMWHAYGAGG